MSRQVIFYTKQQKSKPLSTSTYFIKFCKIFVKNYELLIFTVLVVLELLSKIIVDLIIRQKKI